MRCIYAYPDAIEYWQYTNSVIYPNHIYNDYLL